jgi:hypothetical protein
MPCGEVPQSQALEPCGSPAPSCPQLMGNLDQAACKPGSVHRLAADRRPFLWDGPCGPPHATNPDGARRRACSSRNAHPYSVLLQAGLALPSLSPGTRCALTAPFHPYLAGCLERRFAFCGAIPRVTLPFGHFPGRTLSAALPSWSPDFPPAHHSFARMARQRSPGRLIEPTA